MFNRGRYKFQMMETNGTVLLEERFILKVNGLNCLTWHTKLNHRLKYRLLDTKTNQEVRKDIIYTLLKGHNV